MFLRVCVCFNLSFVVCWQVWDGLRKETLSAVEAAKAALDEESKLFQAIRTVPAENFRAATDAFKQARNRREALDSAEVAAREAERVGCVEAGEAKEYLALQEKLLGDAVAKREAEGENVPVVVDDGSGSDEQGSGGGVDVEKGAVGAEGGEEGKKGGDGEEEAEEEEEEEEEAEEEGGVSSEAGRRRDEDGEGEDESKGDGENKGGWGAGLTGWGAGATGLVRGGGREVGRGGFRGRGGWG